MAKPSEQEMRQAVAVRDKTRDGVFYYGVITTGVFCVPSCNSRPAKPENLRFFDTAEGALIAGYRPCKRCNPMGGDPQIVKLVDTARYIEKHVDDRIPLEVLAGHAHLSASRLQRAFKQAFGMSPKTYQDAVRLRKFKQSLKAGERVTEAIYSSGYGSVSRVYGEASRNIGMSPKTYRAGGEGEQISYACRESSLGIIAMAATDKGVCFVQFGEDETSLLHNLKAEFPNALLTPSPAQCAPELDAWLEALNQYISEGAPRPDLPVDLRGTAFQVLVWRFLMSMQEGKVLSYSELADRVGKPKAARSVATACAKNRIGVLIPCHRILRGDGGLGGYRWGIERKRALLDLERNRSSS